MGANRQTGSSVRIRRLAAAAMAIVAFAACSTTIANATDLCPSGNFAMSGTNMPPISGEFFGAVLDTSYAWYPNPDYPELQAWSTRTRVDWPTGTFLIRGDLSYGERASAAFVAKDSFEVVGITEPALIRARIIVRGDYFGQPHMEGSGCGRTEILLSAQSAPTARSTLGSCSGSRSFDDQLEVEVLAVPSQKFHVSLNASAIGSGGFQGAVGGAIASMRLSFEGLPPGATVMSCHGYTQGSTPARRVSWGSLKHHYR